MTDAFTYIPEILRLIFVIVKGIEGVFIDMDVRPSVKNAHHII